MLKEYLTGVIYTCAFCSAILMITPKGRVRSVVSLACAVAVILSLVIPVTGLDFSQYSELLAGYKKQAEIEAEKGSRNSNNLNRLYIEEQCETYILDKAENIGISISGVSVFLEWSENGCWYPVSAEIDCDCSENERMKLESYIESELGISRKEQKWSTNEKER